MDIQVQELLESIKKDGVEAAEAQAKEILAQAEKKAADIIAEAEKKAQNAQKAQEQAATQLQASGKAALAQAGRDLILTVEKQLQSIFSSLVTSTVQEVYKEETLVKAVQTVVEKLTTDQLGAVVLSEAEGKKLESALKGKIAKALNQGLEIKTSSKISGGFLIQEKNGAAYFDFTTEAVAKALAVYVNPLISEVLSQVK
jgi:V/A-type H+-transporting ATPase subunit E